MILTLKQLHDATTKLMETHPDAVLDNDDGFNSLDIVDMWATAEGRVSICLCTDKDLSESEQ
jgi:hypothetical protein